MTEISYTENQSNLCEHWDFSALFPNKESWAYGMTMSMRLPPTLTFEQVDFHETWCEHHADRIHHCISTYNFIKNTNMMAVQTSKMGATIVKLFVCRVWNNSMREMQNLNLVFSYGAKEMPLHWYFWASNHMDFPYWQTVERHPKLMFN